MGRNAGRDCSARDDLHRVRIGSLAKEKINGRGHCDVGSHSGRTRCRSSH